MTQPQCSRPSRSVIVGFATQLVMSTRAGDALALNGSSGARPIVPRRRGVGLAPPHMNPCPLAGVGGARYGSGPQTPPAAAARTGRGAGGRHDIRRSDRARSVQNHDRTRAGPAAGTHGGFGVVSARVRAVTWRSSKPPLTGPDHPAWPPGPTNPNPTSWPGLHLSDYADQSLPRTRLACTIAGTVGIVRRSA
jgi:hypothetical protein